MKVEQLSWDTTFFNIRIGRILLENEISQITEILPFDLVYLVSPSSHLPNIENFTFSFSEEKLLFEKKIYTASNRSKNIFSFSDIDTEPSDLYSLAYESGRHSRFKLDPNFSEVKFKSLYEAWVDASCSGTFATDVLIYIVKKDPVGFVTFTVNEKKATIGLIAVNPHFQGKGIGSALLEGVENALLKYNCEKLAIPTQLNNKQACAFYKKMGYIQKETTFITHYWRQ